LPEGPKRIRWKITGLPPHGDVFHLDGKRGGLVPGDLVAVRCLAKGSVPDHGNDAVSDGHREYDYLDWIARLTSHIPEKGAQLVHFFGAYSNVLPVTCGFRRNPLRTIAAPANAAAM